MKRRMAYGVVAMALIVSAGCDGRMPRSAAPANTPAAQAADEPWPPPLLAAKLQAEPASDVDKQIKALIADYEARLAGLKPTDPLVRKYLPRLRSKVRILYREYNQPKGRYNTSCFSAAECIESLKAEMQFFLDRGLQRGADPLAGAAGRVLWKACWIDNTRIMGRYTLTVPKAYDPKKPWPISISYQNGPVKAKRRLLPYFWISSVQKGYPKGLTMVENKTRSFLKDAAHDFNVDPFRFYATGFSYGGRTDLIMAWRHPHWFAAIAPVCNDQRDSGRQKSTVYVKYLKNVPALLLHGTGDSFLATGRIVHRYMKDAGCDVTFETYPGGHDAAPIFNNPKRLTDFYDKHVMNPYPKTVSHVVEHRRYSRAFWVDARLVAGDGEAGTFEVRLPGANRVEIDASDRIAELDLYLNAKLVDMTRPVTVVAGGKTAYQGAPSGKLTVKLRDGADRARGRGDTLWIDVLKIQNKAVP